MKDDSSCYVDLRGLEICNWRHLNSNIGMMFVMCPNICYSVSIMEFSTVTTTTYFKVDISVTWNFIVQYASAAFTGIFVVPTDGCHLKPKHVAQCRYSKTLRRCSSDWLLPHPFVLNYITAVRHTERGYWDLKWRSDRKTEKDALWRALCFVLRI